MRISNLLTKRHELKILDKFADDVLIGYKNFEIRENDRGFQKGDTVEFTCVDKAGIEMPHEINKKRYEITYVLNGWGLKDGYVVFGMKDCESCGQRLDLNVLHKQEQPTIESISYHDEIMKKFMKQE